MKAGWGGGFWRLEKRLGLVLGYGNAFGVELVQWGRGEGVPPPFKRFPEGGVMQPDNRREKWLHHRDRIGVTQSTRARANRM